MDPERDSDDPAFADAVTGAFRPSLLDARVAKELDRARRSGSHCSLHRFDVDHFASVNEAYGPARGDQVLRELAERVTRQVRARDTLFRCGADQFVLLLPDATKDCAIEVANRVMAAVRAAPFPGRPPLTLSVSLGLATFPDDAADAAGLLAAADRRRQLAKKQGRALAVADDVDPDQPGPVSFRLLEREDALAAAEDFLGRLPAARRGVLRVTGERGAGHSRFLAEVAKLATARGFDVLAEPGDAWWRWVKGDTERGSALLVVDGAPTHELDEVLAGLAAVPDEAGPIGIVYAAPRGEPRPVRRPPAEPELPLSASVELPPWSTAALRVWLRNTLQGEPSPALLDRLDGQSGGLPAEAERELNRLAERSALERTPAGGWTLSTAEPEPHRTQRTRAEDDQMRIAQRLCQLPPGVPDFTGRDLELVQLADMARQAAVGGLRQAAVATICGQPGVGKTTLAVHLAHQLSEGFPDGQWYVDLRGMDQHPLDPADALTRLLGALGVPPDRIPSDLAERSALYRSLCHDRRLLVVLDNAANEAQVRPLLPAGAGSVMLVTSRRVLAGLEGVRRLSLDMLAADVAVDLLAEIVGRDRVAAEPSAAFEVARLCGYLPLALRVAGNRLASRVTWTFKHLVEQLRDDQRRLELLTAGDLAVRAAFELSYQQLSPDAQAAFRRLALAPGADFHIALAGVLVDDGARAEEITDELADASLIEPAATPGRYRFHDLLRLFARDRLEAEEDPASLVQAEGRMLRWLIDIATWAAAFVDPTGEDSDSSLAAPPGTESITGRAEALRWLDLEWTNWLGAVTRAAELGMHADVLRLGYAMHWYSDVRWYRSEWRQIFQLALDAARALGDRWQEGVMVNYLAWTYSLQGPYEEAARLHQEALLIAREVGNRNEEGWALVYLGNCYRRTERTDEAIERYEQAIEVFREIEYQTGEVTALTHLGETLRQAGQYERSLPYQEEAFAVAVRAGNSLGQAIASKRMGQALAVLGRWIEACGHYENAITCFRVAGNVREEGSVLYCLAQAHRELGNLEAAAGCLEQAVQIFTETRDRRQQAVALQLLGAVTKDLRGAVPAFVYEEQAREIMRQLESPGRRV